MNNPIGKITQRPAARRIFRCLLILPVLALIDGLFIEPNWIQVTHWTVPGNVSATLKIAELTDLHSSHVGFREKRLLKLLDEEAPNIIVVTGDTLSGWGTYRGESEILKRLHAPLGVWLVRGNWEISHPLKHERQFYENLGVHFLLNQCAEVRPGIWLIGLDDPTFGHANLSEALANVPSNAYRIALFHSPQFFSASAGQYDLALAGHSHGGQVRIPFLKPVWLPKGVGPYVEGWFEKNGSRMYVSRGLGMTLLPIRFDCRPELALITIEPVVK
ncbi:MAG TPA: metallophosphoesterase [Candidatus Acidoferrum sp.]|nr:metallophosphoesterase [Candidatus Acidoferrum sp.]